MTTVDLQRYQATLGERKFIRQIKIPISYETTLVTQAM